MAAAVGAVTLGVLACSSPPPPGRSHAAPQPPIAGRSAPGVAPPGTRPVTFHGLTVFVPRAWATNAVKCGAALKNTVFFGDGAQPACGSVGTSRFSIATFSTWQPGNEDRRLRHRSLTIDGHRATLGTGSEDGRHLSELIVADLKARLLIAGPGPGIGNEVVRTAQVTRTDANGCPSTMGYVDLTTPPTTGPADVMVAGTPSKVVICHYLRSFLDQGISLSPADAGRFVTALNALPTGLSEVLRSTYLPGSCRGGRLATQGDASDLEQFSIRISYADRPDAVVYARLGLCGPVGFTNGTRTGQRADGVVNLLNALFDDSLTWPGPVHPR